MGSEKFRYPEVPVITGAGAKEFHLFLTAPGLGTVKQAVGIGPADHIIHQIQAGASAHNDLFLPTAQQVRKIGSCTGHPQNITVVSGLYSVVNTIFRGYNHVQNVADHVQLLGAGLSSCHIQLQLLLQAVLIRLFYQSIFCLSLRIRK